MGKKLFVGNLPFATTEDALTQLFAQYGTVESAKIILDRDTGRSKGFGFVEMSTDEEAASATTKLSGTDYQGKALTVNEARPMTPRSDRGPGGGGRFGRDDRRGGGRGRGDRF